MTSMTAPLPLSADGDGCILAVHATPRARRNSIEGIETDAAGQQWLRIRTTAAPEDGKANKAIIGYLSKQWKTAASCFTLVSGGTSRYKRIRIAAPYHEIAECLK